MYSYLTVDSRSEKKRAPMPLYNTAAHDTMVSHNTGLLVGTNIHTAYSTVHVATSVTVAALHKTNSWTLCHLYENVSIVRSEGSRVSGEVFRGARW